VNLATENHNFHIHQTKFRFVQPVAAPGSLMASPINPKLGAGIMEDNVPLPIATPDPATVANQNGYCTILQWRTGLCPMTPVLVTSRSPSSARSCSTATFSITRTEA
jgi:hypothetical protein